MEVLPRDSAETEGLLTRVVGGDAAAMDALVDRHRRSLCDFLDHRIGPDLQGRLDASDVVHDTFLEAIRRMDDFLRRRPMPFRVWLRKTAYQRLLMLRRRHLGAGRRDARREIALPDASSIGLAQRLACPASSPGHKAERAEQVKRVQLALRQLAVDDREVLLMRNFEDLPYAEVAVLLDITADAARQRHGRALMRLSQLLSADSGRSHD